MLYPRLELAARVFLSSPPERDPILYLEDIVLSMQRVEEYIVGLNIQHFKWDYKTVDAIVRNFEIIGKEVMYGETSKI